VSRLNNIIEPIKIIRKYLTILLATILCTCAYAQEVEGLMKRKYIPCDDIIYNSLFLIPEHFERNNMDTVTAIVSYWEKHCGISEPLLRIKILLAINADTLHEKIYNNIPIINYLSYYREMRTNDRPAYNFEPYYLVPPASDSFDHFTKELALKLRKKKSNSELDNFFLDFYSNNFDNIFFRLQDTLLTNSILKLAYEKEVGRYINLPEWHYSIYSGIWIPTGNIRIVGNHPIIGFQIGLRRKNLLIDGAIDFKFGSSPKTYFVEENDSLYSTTHFFGGFFGVELGYNLINYKTHELDVLTGIGFDGFDALSIGNSKDPDRIAKSINSLNLNLGIGYRKYFKNKTYIGLEARYNFVNYQNTNGTDLTGNTLTIRLKYGISRNLRRDENLRRLDNKKL